MVENFESDQMFAQLSEKILVNALKPVLVEFADKMVSTFGLDRQKVFDVWNSMVGTVHIDFSNTDVKTVIPAAKKSTSAPKPEIPSKMSNDEVMKLNLPDLKALAKQRGISGYTKMKKADLQARLTSGVQPTVAVESEKSTSKDVQQTGDEPPPADLMKLTVKVLQEQAKSLGIPVTKLKKAELANVIAKKRGAPTSTETSKPSVEKKASLSLKKHAKYDGYYTLADAGKHGVLVLRPNKIVAMLDGNDNKVPLDEDTIKECKSYEKLVVEPEVFTAEELEFGDDPDEDEDEDEEPTNEEVDD